MYKDGQVLILKPDAVQEGLPSEVTVVKQEIKDGGVAVTVSSEAGTFESTQEILDTFYVVKEEFSLESLPKLTVQAIDEVLALFDAFAATQSPLAGVQVKTKLMGLKDNIAKTAGLKTEPTHHLLGKKVA